MNIVIASLIPVIIVLCYYTYKSNQYETDSARYIAKVLAAGLFICFTVIFEGLCTTSEMSHIAYGLYFAGTDWLVYHLMRFLLVYIGKDPDVYMNKAVWWAVFCWDTAYICSNVYHRLAFDVVQTAFNGLTIFKFEAGRFFWVHMIPIYGLITASILLLAYKTVREPRIFRKKYYPFLFLILAIVLCNAYCMFFGTSLDISVYGYAFGAICLHYFALVYIPKELVDRTLALASDDSVEGLIIFDQVKCIYTNKSVRRMLAMETKDALSEHTVLQEDFDLHHLDQYDDITYTKTSTIGGTKTYLKIFFKRIEDAKRRYLGSFFSIMDMTEEIENLERERFQSTHDELTGLFNREYFYIRAEQMIRERPDTEFLLLCSDIAKFKMVNDLFGQYTGDYILKRIADALRTHCSEFDVYGRLGDDHFALLIPKERFEEEVFLHFSEELTRIDNNVEFPLVTHVGVYEVTNRAMPVSAMCDRANLAIMTVKGDFRNRIAYYNEGMRQALLREQAMLGELDSALEKEELTIYLQPQVDADRRILGAEALVRWIHPKKGVILPADFISVFEKNGVIAKMDIHIWNLACRLLKKWQEEGDNDRYISVNISPNDFYFFDIYDQFTSLVRTYGIDPAKLRLELTETAAMGDPKKLTDLIDKLHEAGFVVEMDDFGSGYSSLNLLKDINVDVIKMDMRFLEKTDHLKRSETILEFMINLSKKLGVEVVCEGVETEEQVSFLQSVGCEVFQGYFYSRPVSVQEFETLARR
ncbi:MAG: EAL domain-containing protein [Lachnospiraceae bacterium]|nr:EAL domain-containing protein [Lachnospiraceae bacterium]